MYTIESHHHHITPRTRTSKEPHYQYRTTDFGITTPHHWFHHTTPYHTDFDITTHTDIEPTTLPIHHKTSHTTISHHSHGHQNKYTTTIEIRTSESPQHTTGSTTPHHTTRTSTSPPHHTDFEITTQHHTLPHHTTHTDIEITTLQNHRIASHHTTPKQ